MRVDAEASYRRAFPDQSRAGAEALRRKANSLARSWRMWGRRSLERIAVECTGKSRDLRYGTGSVSDLSFDQKAF
jgi:hypothetical protein